MVEHLVSNQNVAGSSPAARLQEGNMRSNDMQCNYVIVSLLRATQAGELDSVLLTTVKDVDLEATIEQLKKRGFTRHNYAIIRGDVVKGFYADHLSY